jgi:hypothetical protein
MSNINGNRNPTRRIQEKYYRDLYNKKKGTTMIVSSESWAHKNVRFEKITNLMKDDDKFSVHDVGMGIADMYQYMRNRFPNKSFIYSGTEILGEYYEEAKNRFPECNFFLRDIAESAFEEHYDYLIMSGIFHQRRESSIRDWEKFAQQIISNSFKMCNKGIAFNFISPFVDFYQTEVYYANMPKILNFINDDLSRFFTVYHDYPLFEFTVHVYKEEYIKLRYQQSELQKYFHDANI